MAHLIQVGAGSGGMPVLDMLCRDARITRVTLIEPDVYKPHNVERHLFPSSGVGEPKAELAERWLKERRPDLKVQLLGDDLLDPGAQDGIEEAIAVADLGVCAADNEPAKYHWDSLMRKHHKLWTLGEVLSGGIGGFVHWFSPDGPCYGCVASRLNREAPAEKAPVPDYSQPGGAIAESTVPAGISPIHSIASLHALITQQMLATLYYLKFAVSNLQSEMEKSLGFTSLLVSMQKVPDVFEEAFRPYRFRVP